MNLRVQIKNKGNSDIIAELSEKSTLIKRTGLPVKGRRRDHLGAETSYNKNQGLTTFDIKDNLLHLVPNDGHILINGRRVSAKQFKISINKTA